MKIPDIIKALEGDDPATLLEAAQTDKSILRHKPRFFITTDFTTFCAYDLKRAEEIQVPFFKLYEKMTTEESNA